MAAIVVFPTAATAGKERAWLGPSSFIAGAPSARQALGLAAAGGRIYVHGGQGPSGAHRVGDASVVRARVGAEENMHERENENAPAIHADLTNSLLLVCTHFVPTSVLI
jgi:hypothetical protein